MTPSEYVTKTNKTNAQSKVRNPANTPLTINASSLKIFSRSNRNKRIILVSRASLATRNIVMFFNAPRCSTILLSKRSTTATETMHTSNQFHAQSRPRKNGQIPSMRTLRRISATKKTVKKTSTCNQPSQERESTQTPMARALMRIIAPTIGSKIRCQRGCGNVWAGGNLRCEYSIIIWSTLSRMNASRISSAGATLAMSKF
mmetsp:Transcript_58430/g.169496  ORF Transcript_58430/g.169496 Transcript_58430/m.169496 type:complete len:202 (-) Transcript_58430:1344-1949(-)